MRVAASTIRILVALVMAAGWFFAFNAVLSYDEQDLDGIWVFDEKASRETMREHYDDWVITAGFRGEKRSLIVFDSEAGVAVKAKDRSTITAVCTYDVTMLGKVILHPCKTPKGELLDGSTLNHMTVSGRSLHVTDGKKYKVSYFRLMDTSPGLALAKQAD